MNEGKRRNELKIRTLIRIKIHDLPTDTVAQWEEHRRDVLKDLGSNPGECHIFTLFRCVLSFSATLAKRWKVHYRLGIAKNSMLIEITAYKYIKKYYSKEIESTVDIHRKNTVNKEKCRSKVRTKERNRRS